VSRDGRRSGAELLLLMETAATSAVGGLLAVLALWYDDRLIQPVVVLAVAFAVVVFCVMAVNTLRPDPPARTPPARKQPGGARIAYPQPLISGHQYPPHVAGPPPVEPVHTWFDDAARDAAAQQGAVPAMVGTAAQVPPEPEGPGLASHIEEHRIPGSTSAVRRVVQCPRCAGFDLDVREEPGAFTFGCQSCRHVWRWTPDTPWPPTIARPALGNSHRNGSV
jgi:hypothetical protein